jgi:DNA repair protein RecN (Recombination protein N)
MINRFYLQNYLSFKSVDIEFDKGLNVFTGPSGAGKSILLKEIVSLFGFCASGAKISEININKSAFSLNDYDLSLDDELCIKQLGGAKSKYSLNSQNITKTALKNACSGYARHLSLKEIKDFDSAKNIEFLDFLIIKENNNFKLELQNYKELYDTFKTLTNKLKDLLDAQQNTNELQERLNYELERINECEPKLGEYEELLVLKNTLSLKDKISKEVNDGQMCFSTSSHISKALKLLGENSNNFDDAINEANFIISKAMDSFTDEEDIEKLLGKIEKYGYLIKKYGDIKTTITKQNELKIKIEELDDISFNISITQKNLKIANDKLKQASVLISLERNNYLPNLNECINRYLKLLYLKNANLNLNPQINDINGGDILSFSIDNVDINKLSSGEFNRFRLALLCAKSEFEFNSSGVLFLDEIDANLSGKESASIAKVLQYLAKSYQIFAISHQPQLSALATVHYLVQKNDGVSSVLALNYDDRIKEISRIISGANINEEAVEFAKSILKKPSLD